MTQFGFGIARIDGAAAINVIAGRRCRPLRDLTAHAPETFNLLLRDWDDAVDEVSRRADPDAQGWLPLDSTRLLAPCVSRPAIYRAGANYSGHIKEMGAEDSGIHHFVSPPGVINDPGEPVRRPHGVKRLD